MLEVMLSADDTASVRFAVSPAVEVAGSLQRFRRPGLHSASRPWESTLADRLHGFDVRRLTLIVSARRWLPDFVTPFPETPRTTFEAELARIAATDAEVVARDVRAAHPDGLPPAIAAGLRDPAALRDDIVCTLADWWDAAIAPWWPRILPVLEADIGFRTEQLGAAGLRDTLAGLDERIVWQGDRIRLHVAAHGAFRTTVAGGGLPLVPSVFTRWPATNVSAHRPPFVAYPAREAANVWNDDDDGGHDALAGLLGRGRTAVLRAVEAPRGPSEIAAQLGVTPSAVSQHLRVLGRTGLIARTRHGRRVTYRRTPLGDELVSSAG